MRHVKDIIDTFLEQLQDQIKCMKAFSCFKVHNITILYVFLYIDIYEAYCVQLYSIHVKETNSSHFK